IHYSTTNSAAVSCTYTSPQSHSLYLGTRAAENCTSITVLLDGQALTMNLALPGEDVLVRKRLGQLGAGQHTITITHDGPSGTYVYFDYLEVTIPGATLSVSRVETYLT